MDLSRQEVKSFSLEFLQFLLPGYEVKNSITSLDSSKKIIFTGPFTERNKIKLDTIPEDYVIASGRPNVDLNTRMGVLTFIYSKYNKEVPKYFEDIINIYDDDEFLYCIKVFWVSGKWPYKLENETSMYDLFQATIDSVPIMLSKAIEVLDSYPDYVVLSSLITFVSRAVDVEDQSVSSGYKRLLKTFLTRYESNISPAFKEFVSNPISDKKLKSIFLLMELRK